MGGKTWVYLLSSMRWALDLVQQGGNNKHPARLSALEQLIPGDLWLHK